MSAGDTDQQQFSAGARTGWEAALLEIEHQAQHWDTPDHGQTGYLIAQALRAAVDIARAGGLRCAHRAGRASSTERAVQLMQAADEASPPPRANRPEQHPSAAA